mgnify:FL=1
MARLIVCADCGEEKPHEAKGLCRACYMRCWQEEHQEERVAYKCCYHKEHRERKAAYDRHYYQEHRKEKAAKDRRWAKENPEKVAAKFARRKALKRSQPDTLTPEQAEQLFAIGRATYPGEKLHLDHFIPLIAGGGTTLANVHAIPAEMNQSKSDRLPRDIYCQLELV